MAEVSCYRFLPALFSCSGISKRKWEVEMESHRIIQVEEKVPFNLLVPLSIQHMFAMFGASVLVPFLFGINPAIVLFMNGVGTLFHRFRTPLPPMVP